MTENILVTGGAGYIGSHTCKALKRAGYTPVAVDNLVNGHRTAVKWGPLEVIDIHDKEALVKILRNYKPTAVIHFAGYAYVGESVVKPEIYYHNNVLGSLSLFDAMKETDITNIIFSSTCAVYGQPDKLPLTEESALKPINPYGRSKKMIEEILQDYEKAYDFKFISLRYFNAAGADEEGEIGESHDPETHVIPLCLQAAGDNLKEFSILGTDYPTADGTCVRDYVHVSDLAQGHVEALKFLEKNKKSEIFNLGTGIGCSVKELVTASEKITGRKIKQRTLPRRVGDPAILIADCKKAERYLNWKPQHKNIESSIEHAWKWHLKTGK